LRDCAFLAAGTPLVLTTPARSVVLRYCLHTGDGPLIRLGTAPTASFSGRIGLEHVTVRNAAGVLEIAPPKPGPPGRLDVSAEACLFDLPARAALVTFVAANAEIPEPTQVSFVATGSVVRTGTQLAAAVTQADRIWRPLEDRAVLLEDLVVGEFEFAGDNPRRIADAQLTTLRAPRRSQVQPGIDVARFNFAQSSSGTREKGPTRESDPVREQEAILPLTKGGQGGSLKDD
jgi:hypothetical protein